MRAAKLEHATLGDAAEIAALYVAARNDALPFLHRLHRDDEVRAWIRDILMPQAETWVARREGRILGFMALIGDELDQLYLHPSCYRQGIGTAFVAKAKTLSPERLRLFTFARNRRARAFYESHGFRIVDRSDGTHNEEGEPDIRYEWVPAPG